MGATARAEGNPPGVAIEPSELRRRFAGSVRARRFLETKNPKNDAIRIEKRVLVRAVKRNAPVCPRNEMPASGTVNFTRLVIENLMLEESVFCVFKHASV